MKPADVEEQFKKSPELKREDVAKLQDWMSKQTHLPRITGEFLKFLSKIIIRTKLNIHLINLMINSDPQTLTKLIHVMITLN